MARPNIRKSRPERVRKGQAFSLSLKAFLHERVIRMLLGTRMQNMVDRITAAEATRDNKAMRQQDEEYRETARTAGHTVRPALEQVTADED